MSSPPFAFPRATATQQSKSTSTRELHETRSTDHVEMTTTSFLPSGGSPTSAVSQLVYASPQDVRGMPCTHVTQWLSTAPNPVLLMPGGDLTASRPRQMIEQHRL
jgi:hypothetical protein